MLSLVLSVPQNMRVSATFESVQAPPWRHETDRQSVQASHWTTQIILTVPIPYLYFIERLYFVMNNMPLKNTVYRYGFVVKYFLVSVFNYFSDKVASLYESTNLRSLYKTPEDLC